MDISDKTYAIDMCCSFHVGTHISKSKSLPLTIKSIQDFTKPYQIFLGSPQSSTLNISSEELALTAKMIDSTDAQMYIHSQYIINLSHPFSSSSSSTVVLPAEAAAAAAAASSSSSSLSDPLIISPFPASIKIKKSSPDKLMKTKEIKEIKVIKNVSSTSWHTNLLIKNVQYGVAMGAKGVVVHVGKSVGMPYKVALENMYENLKRVIPYATKECPILLETPAGQGTETLTDIYEFISFVESFNDERIGICLDTCHVFVCGYNPTEIINLFIEDDAPEKRRNLLRLIHYNDAAVSKGTRKDRHAFVGTGYIGIKMMEDIARICYSIGLPMIIE